MRKQLLLLRHAKSDWSSAAQTDFERPLNSRGRRDALKMGRWLGENGHAPAVIIGSPSARTIETIEWVRVALKNDAECEVIHEQRLYHGAPEQIRETATAQLLCHDRVLIVAHNPGMERALLAYCPTAKRFADGKLMPTCGLAVIEFDRAEAADARRYPAGNLRALLRPADL